MHSRRTFLQLLLLAAAGCTRAATNAGAGANGPGENDAHQKNLGALLPDPGEILDLPEGFSYQVLSRPGDAMDDGLLVPGRADGMAAFAGDNGQVILVRNHELHPLQQHIGPFGPRLARLAKADPELIYDRGGDLSPGNGGTTTLIFDPQANRVVSQHLSLAGTELNCAGGATPWGSWLSCEECEDGPGQARLQGYNYQRAQFHGYVFEVPAKHRGLVPPQPIKAMGRFEHEAAAVDPRTGIVYLTEDKHEGLLYRYLPDVPGQLLEGGRLQALSVPGRPGVDTRNWYASNRIGADEILQTAWIDLKDVDTPDNDLRFRGRAAGAAVFARGEGICLGSGELFFNCTIGGKAQHGQVFRYQPSPGEGSTTEHEQPGQLSLLLEASGDGAVHKIDNGIVSPWGDLLACEDNGVENGLVGISLEGANYRIANNPYNASELAGACFAPDGRTLFVNIQEPGLTLAINGPWPV